jgi:hypothetical protein
VQFAVDGRTLAACAPPIKSSRLSERMGTVLSVVQCVVHAKRTDFSQLFASTLLVLLCPLAAGAPRNTWAQLDPPRLTPTGPGRRGVVSVGSEE